MPLPHIVATLAIVALCLRAAFDFWQVMAGRRSARSPFMHMLMVVLCGLVLWQTTTWLGTAHPEATTTFRSAIWVQLISAALLGAISLSLSWRTVRARAGGVRR